MPDQAGFFTKKNTVGGGGGRLERQYGGKLRLAGHIHTVI
jgi:hypothetical protein